MSDFVQDTSEPNVYTPLEEISKDIFTNKNIRYKDSFLYNAYKTTYEERLSQETLDYIIDVYTRFAKKSSTESILLDESKHLRGLFLKTLDWVCTNAAKQNGIKQTNLDVQWINDVYDLGDDISEQISTHLIKSKVNILYLAQIVSLFDNMEVISRTGDFGECNKWSYIYDYESDIKDYIKYNKYYDKTITVKDFMECMKYFYDPKRLNVLFAKTNIVNFGFAGLYEEREDYRGGMIFHSPDEEPLWAEENGGDPYEYAAESSTTYYDFKDDYFSFGYVMNNPFNVYDILVKNIPFFDEDKQIQDWLINEVRKTIKGDYYDYIEKYFSIINEDLRDNTFYNKLVESNKPEGNAENFYSQGIYNLNFCKPIEPGNVFIETQSNENLSYIVPDGDEVPF